MEPFDCCKIVTETGAKRTKAEQIRGTNPGSKLGGLLWRLGIELCLSGSAESYPDKFGFLDFNVTRRGNLTGEQPYKALNCALITWNTNRNISAKEPIQCLRERVLNAVLGENQIRSRLRTHAIPFDALNVGGYATIADADERAGKVSHDYDAFLTARGLMALAALKELCEGKNWSGMDNGADG